jgi:hypothetical protein
MAHEFGHVVAGGLQGYDAEDEQVRRPVETWLEAFQGLRRQQATELFCDVFATYALGPSYPCTLVLNRLDPMAPAVADETATHPGDASRVHACLWTLRRMQRAGEVAGPYDHVIWQLSTAWQQLQRQAPESARLLDADQGALGALLAGCWVALENNLGEVRYTWSMRVRDLVSELEGRASEPARAGYSAADVLNAAWIRRLDVLGDAARVADLENDANRLLRAALTG